jgi:hypothetical protein
MTFPLITLPQGLTWSYTKSPKFTTTQQVPQSGRHPASATLQESTIFDLTLEWDYLAVNGQTTANDFEYLKSFYEAMRGSFGWFLFDPSQYDLESLDLTQDYTQLANGFCGQGDGTTTVFPMWRSSAVLSGGSVTLLEQIQNVTLLTGVYLNGTLQAGSAYSHTNLPGVITFHTAPASGVNIAWAGTYSYLVHFSDDTADFDEFIYQLWRLKTLKLETINL